MIKNDTGLYTAFKSKDARFDGRFFVGVSSTGIYCRPVCRARQPKIENCTFFSTAAEAENAGYRPCLLCRPELAPGSSITDATSVLAQKTARILEENCGNAQSLAELAAQLGCTDRHLRRAFAAEFHVSPVQYLQTCRLLLAKNLLTDTGLSVIDVAMASGFGSLRRFNDAFKTHYRLSPSALRRQTTQKNMKDSNITISLGYRPPYLWDDVIKFLSGRAIPGIDMVKDDMYWRTAHFRNAENEDVYGWIKVHHNAGKNSLRITVSEALLPVLPQVLGKLRHMFDLYCEPQIIYQTLSSMNEIHPDLCKLGTRLPGCFDDFEMAVRAVLGQQISVKAASTLAGRLVSKYGTPIQTGVDGLTHVFPSPEKILALKDTIEHDFGILGITSARSKTIMYLADAFTHKEISFGICSNPEEEVMKLLRIQGIGNWTAQYIAMRTMAWTDAFLETDVGVKKALAPYTPRESLKIAEAWRPWCSYAVMNLWNSL